MNKKISRSKPINQDIQLISKIYKKKINSNELKTYLLLDQKRNNYFATYNLLF